MNATFSPSLLAISAIERSMMVVETGNSMASAARPNTPPTAPDTPAAILCKRSLEREVPTLPSQAKDLTATSSAFINAASDASCTVFCTRAGSIAMPRSIGEPSIAEARAARPGFSSSVLARFNAARSALDKPDWDDADLLCVVIAH